MSNLFLTLVIAFVIIVLAIACLAIGWLITGKTKLEAGACGRDPHKKKDQNCGTGVSCTLCNTEPPSTNKKADEKEEERTDEQL